MQQSQAESSAASTPLAIDEIVARVTSIENNGQLRELVALLNTLNKQSLVSYTTDGLDPLTVLNPTTHSLGYLYFITARCLEATSQTGLQLFQLIHHFIQVFDPEQIYLAPEKFTLVGKALLHLAKVLHKPSLPLPSFVVAIERFAESPYTITSIHSPFIQACVTAKHYNFPLTILDRDIETIDTKYDVNIQNFLQYYYYGSIVYVANKNFERALDFLSIVISAPIQKAVSAIQIAAYKKFILVSLIYKGAPQTLPKYTGQGVEKVCKAQSAAYLKLLRAFNETDLKMFNDIASSSSAIFQNDGHLGLIKQCYQSLRRKKIMGLTKVYITVGLNEMAKKIGNVSPEELELILIEMINQNQVSASISVTDQLVKMVHFEDQDKQEENLNLVDRILQITNVNDRVSYMDKLEGLNKEFQTKYMTLSTNGGQMAAAPFDEDFDLPMDDDTKIF